MSQHDLLAQNHAEDIVPVIPITASVLLWDFQLYIGAIAYHFQQYPWETGSTWAESAGQGEVGWYTQRVKTTWPCLGLAPSHWPYTGA